MNELEVDQTGTVICVNIQHHRANDIRKNVGLLIPFGTMIIFTVLDIHLRNILIIKHHTIAAIKQACRKYAVITNKIEVLLLPFIKLRFNIFKSFDNHIAVLYHSRFIPCFNKNIDNFTQLTILCLLDTFIFINIHTAQCIIQRIHCHKIAVDDPEFAINRFLIVDPELFRIERNLTVQDRLMRTRIVITCGKLTVGPFLNIIPDRPSRQTWVKYRIIDQAEQLGPGKHFHGPGRMNRFKVLFDLSQNCNFLVKELNIFLVFFCRRFIQPILHLCDHNSQLGLHRELVTQFHALGQSIRHKHIRFGLILGQHAQTMCELTGSRLLLNHQ